MLITGIIGNDGKVQTANLVNSILSATGKKISIIDSCNLAELDLSRVKSYVSELEKNNTDILILKINIMDVEKEFFNGLHFDVIICTDKADDLKGVNLKKYSELMKKIFSLLDEKGTAIVNVDESELIQFLQGMKHYIVTFGFNSKASITTSSIGDFLFKDNFMCCLQRTISTRNGMLIEPQEYKIRLETGELNTYDVLAAATFAIVNGIDLNSVGFSEPLRS